MQIKQSQRIAAKPKTVFNVRSLYDREKERKVINVGHTEKGAACALTSIGDTFYLTDGGHDNVLYSSKKQNRVVEHSRKLNINWT